MLRGDINLNSFQQRYLTLPTSDPADLSCRGTHLNTDKERTEGLTQTTGSSPCPDFCFQSGT